MTVRYLQLVASDNLTMAAPEGQLPCGNYCVFVLVANNSLLLIRCLLLSRSLQHVDFTSFSLISTRCCLLFLTCRSAHVAYIPLLVIRCMLFKVVFLLPLTRLLCFFSLIISHSLFLIACYCLLVDHHSSVNPSYSLLNC